MAAFGITVNIRLEELERAARSLGRNLPSPFFILSLPVIPDLMLTDKGLVDVMKGELLTSSVGLAG